MYAYSYFLFNASGMISRESSTTYSTRGTSCVHWVFSAPWTRSGFGRTRSSAAPIHKSRLTICRYSSRWKWELPRQNQGAKAAPAAVVLAAATTVVAVAAVTEPMQYRLSQATDSPWPASLGWGGERDYVRCSQMEDIGI